MKTKDQTVEMCLRYMTAQARKIEAYEQKHGMPSHAHRCKMNLMANVLHHLGISREYWPEEPYLDPEHVARWQERVAAKRGDAA